MTSSASTARSASHTVRVDRGSLLPAELAATAPEPRRALWAVERDLWTPRTLVARAADGTPLGAALTASRPFCAYRKIVDVVAADDAVWAELLLAARDDAGAAEGAEPSERHPDPLAVHLEEHLAFAALSDARRAALADAGFTPVARPVPSIPSTRRGDAAEVAAWSHWRGAAPERVPAYYGQTTEVTCGAVAALMALETRGLNGFNPDSLNANRDAELALWRRATNLPACEPVGLAVETAKFGRETRVLTELPEVFLSASDPVLIEDFSQDEAERALRRDLQRESLRQAEELGLAVERSWLEVDEIVDRVRRGHQVLLLIDLTELIDDPTPHWVLASEVVGDTLLVSDPWVHYPNAETWVDTFALPMPFATVDRVTRWGSPAFRGAIVLPLG